MLRVLKSLYLSNNTAVGSPLLSRSMETVAVSQIQRVLVNIAFWPQAYLQVLVSMRLD